MRQLEDHLALLGCASALHWPQRLALPAWHNVAPLGRVCSAGMTAMIAMIDSDDVDDGDGDGDGDDDDDDEDDDDDSDDSDE